MLLSESADIGLGGATHVKEKEPPTPLPTQM